MFVFPLVDAGFQDAEGHWLLNDIVVVRNKALVDTAMEQSRRIMATPTMSDKSSTQLYQDNLLVFPIVINRHDHIHHRLP
jgi:hypothetical protein